jgi:steroid delta-isomerase-like uncharacterized protein
MDRREMNTRVTDGLAAWNRGDVDGVLAGVAEDVIWRDVVLGVLNGRSALRDAIESFLTAFPDSRIEETSSTFAGPRLAQELTITGTHRGELLGVPATGRWTESYAAAVVTFDDDGLLIEGAIYWNALSMLCQLGVSTGFAAAAA